MKKSQPIICLFFTIFAFIACIPNNPVPSGVVVLEQSDITGYPLENITIDGSNNINQVQFSNDFKNWLSQNNYNLNDFAPSNIAGSGFGGRNTTTDSIKNHPIIFIHGNSDKAIGNSFGQSGWTRSINFFKKHGYNNAELYAMTWGDANPLTASQNYHSKENILKIRNFIEAVIQYTAADKVDIISHSMGVTLCRKAIKGGSANDLIAGGNYTIGNSLTNKIDVFVGIAGGNVGLANCYITGPTTPTCGNTNGFYPGTAPNGLGLSTFLKELNSSNKFEGSYIYSIWSSVDEIIGAACVVWGKNTCWIPGQNNHKQFLTAPYGHFGVKDNSMNVQYEMVKNRRVI